jgi:hypothetical protein
VEIETVRLKASAYEIELPGLLPRRNGALIQAEFKNGVFGFADLMAWPELGDQSLQDELDRIRSGSPTQLGHQVLSNAWGDAQGRAENRSLWTSGMKCPPSHYLIGTPDDLEKFLSQRELGSPRGALKTGIAVKIKWAGNLNPSLLETMDFRWRIDFNERASREDIQALLKSTRLKSQIDFLEDPFPEKNLEDWKWLKESHPEVRIFGDFAPEINEAIIEFCDGFVLKPASRSFEKALQSQRSFCVTHSLGHPLGHMTAAWHAAQIYKTHPTTTSGFLPRPRSMSHWSYPDFPPGEGYGFETSELLKLSWKSL